GETREPSAARWPLEWRGAGAGVLRAFHAHCGAGLGGGWKAVVRRIRLVESREFLAWSTGLLCPVRLWWASNVDLPYARSRRRSHGLCQRRRRVGRSAEADPGSCAAVAAGRSALSCETIEGPDTGCLIVAASRP